MVALESHNKNYNENSNSIALVKNSHAAATRFISNNSKFLFALLMRTPSMTIRLIKNNGFGSFNIFQTDISLN